jgi:hypothetical protein
MLLHSCTLQSVATGFGPQHSTGRPFDWLTRSPVRCCGRLAPHPQHRLTRALRVRFAPGGLGRERGSRHRCRRVRPGEDRGFPLEGPLGYGQEPARPVRDDQERNPHATACNRRRSARPDRQAARFPQTDRQPRRYGALTAKGSMCKVSVKPSAGRRGRRIGRGYGAGGCFRARTVSSACCGNG